MREKETSYAQSVSTHQGLHVVILIIGQNKEDVGLGGRHCQYWRLCKKPYETAEYYGHATKYHDAIAHDVHSCMKNSMAGEGHGLADNG